MNLHAVVSGAIGAVNPAVQAVVQVSKGATTGPGGVRTPAYLPPQTVPAQVQSLVYNDLVQIDGLNIQGVRRAIYFYGDVEGLVRQDNKGGDLVTLPDGSVYLVAMVLEHWRGWCKVVATLQDGS